ncbi:MAG: hypothetical protein K0R65_1208 [Crocinitomicaceae bacterium]|jgi:hypothetical protein|nr:hypothetical protein [Crocinitomicaceae bacterium]
MLRHTFLSLLCFCTFFSQAQKLAYNSLNTHIRQENGKYGIASVNSDWLVKAEYDTIFERRVFPYRVPVAGQSDAASGNIVFVLLNYPEGRYWRELEFTTSEVTVEMRKINGDKIGEGNYDGYKFLDDIYWTEEKTTYTSQAIVLYEKGLKTLVEPGFSITKNAYKDIDLYTDLQLYLVENTDGTFALINKRKETILKAKHIHPLIYTARFIGISLKHDLGNQVNLPYFEVTHENGEKQLFDVIKNDYVTPRLSAAATDDLVLDFDQQNPGGKIDYTYFDKGLMGVYVSGYKTGTPCIYKKIEFLDESKNLLRVQKEGEEFERLVYMPDPSVSYEFDELIDGDMDFWKGGNGLILKFEGKYRGFMNGRVTPYYDNLSVNSSLKSMFTYKVNGKYGATDGEVTIPAVFPEEIKFSEPLKHLQYDLVYTSQKCDSFYYDTRGNKRVSKSNLFDIRNSGKGKLILVEYYEEDDSKFRQSVPEEFKSLNATSSPGIFIASNLKGKWGIMDVFGRVFLPFEYDMIDEMEQQNKDISLFELKQGKNKAVFNFRHGIVTPLSPASYNLVQEANDTYFIETWMMQGKKMYFGLYTLAGKEIFPMKESYESITFKRQNDLNTMLERINKTSETVWISKKLLPEILVKREFMFTDESFGYVKDPARQEMQVYSLKTGHLEQVLTYEQFALHLGHHVKRDGTAYIVHFTNMQMDTPVPMEIRVDSLDFVINDIPMMIGKKGKKWMLYQPFENELPYFETSYTLKK